MIRMHQLALALLLAGTATFAPSTADAAVTVTITGSNTARADFALGGTTANPLYTGTVYLTFEQPIGLSAANLNISAQIVNPADPALLARLPAGGQVSVPSNFPVMISVNPPATGGFEFVNAAKVDVYTTKLSYTSGIPYRLYKSPSGGAFADITEDVIAGSIRCRSRTGSFSDFIMVVDTRTDLQAASQLFARLNGRLDDDDIDPTTQTALQLDLDEAFEEFEEGEYGDAREELDDLETRIDLSSGVTVPNRWLAGGSLNNVAGNVEAEAAALDYYLRKLEAAGGEED
jgi:hypothetical protein